MFGRRRRVTWSSALKRPSPTRSLVSAGWQQTSLVCSLLHRPSTRRACYAGAAYSPAHSSRLATLLPALNRQLGSRSSRALSCRRTATAELVHFTTTLHVSLSATFLASSGPVAQQRQTHPWLTSNGFAGKGTGWRRNELQSGSSRCSRVARQLRLPG